jgi:hypothetical protein
MSAAKYLVLGSAALASVSGCGPEGSAASAPEALESEAEAGQIDGHFSGAERVLEFSARSQTSGVADVALRIDALRFAAHFDYRAGEVVLDGQGAALDRAAHGALLEAASALAAELGELPEPPLEQRALYAAVVAWQQSGGVALPEKRFVLPRTQPAPGAAIEKSLLDDGVGCVQRGEAYAVSFDYGDLTVLDETVTADSWECNGLCGPYCVELTPWQMWTLDCLEHDQCCRATDTPDCWAPLGECGDEYEAAIADFLRGFDPFGSHCGG